MLNSPLALLLSLFYVIREFARFLHPGWAKFCIQEWIRSQDLLIFLFNHWYFAHLPSQVVPFPVKPCWHMQPWEPSILKQKAFSSHVLRSDEHSSISDDLRDWQNRTWLLGSWSWKSASFILMFSAYTQALPSPINTVVCIHSERMRNWDWSQETLIDLVSYVSLWRRQCFNSFRSSKVLVSCYPRKLCHLQWILVYSCIYKIPRC